MFIPFVLRLVSVSVGQRYRVKARQRTPSRGRLPCDWNFIHMKLRVCKTLNSEGENDVAAFGLLGAQQTDVSATFVAVHDEGDYAPHF